MNKLAMMTRILAAAICWIGFAQRAELPTGSRERGLGPSTFQGYLAFQITFGPEKESEAAKN